MELIRYELSLDGERQGVGIMQGLDDVSNDYYSNELALQPFNEKLPIPDRKYFDTANNYKVLSYFTQKGIETFEKDITKLISYIENNGFSVIKLEKDVDVNNEELVVYKDEYQVLVIV